MVITRKEWQNYISRLSKINTQAADLMRDAVVRYGFDNMNVLINYAYGLTTAYGEAAAALSAEMYDAIAELQGRLNLPPAVPAEPQSYGDVAKTVKGIHKTTENAEEYAAAIGRLVKQTGADTMLINAQRDGAEWAWVPNGDTCAFCLTLASRGWQKLSPRLREVHAEHIHSNCDCTFAIRFSPDLNVEGYDPDKYLDIYENAEGNTPKDKINAMRREFYAENKNKVGINSSKAEEYIE